GGPAIGAAGSQTYPFAASNGLISFVAWTDTREATSENAVYGTRIDGDGNVLDPFGVRLGNRHLDGGMWNGDSVVVAIGTTFVFLTPNLAITTRTLDLPSAYRFAAAGAGADARALFLSGSDAAIVGGRGDVLAQAKTSPWYGRIACAAGEGFL